MPAPVAHSHCPVCGAMWPTHVSGNTFRCKNHACDATYTIIITGQPRHKWSDDDHP